MMSARVVLVAGIADSSSGGDWWVEEGELMGINSQCKPVFCQGRLSSHLQTSAVTDVRTPPHRLLMWHRSRLKGTKGLLEVSGVWVRVWWNKEGLQMSCKNL